MAMLTTYPTLPLSLTLTGLMEGLTTRRAGKKRRQEELLRLQVPRAPAGVKADARKKASALKYVQWAHENKISAFPLEYINVAGYIVHWVGSVGGSTASLAGKISQLKTYFSLMGEPWLSAGDAGKLAQMVKDLEYLDVRATCKKEPIRWGMLVDMLRLKDLTNPVELCEAVMMLLCYRAALRSGELTSGLTAADICWDDDGKGFRVLLLRTKTHRRGAAISVHIREDRLCEFCCVRLMRKYFRESKLFQHPLRYLFPSIGRYLDVTRHCSYSMFVNIIKRGAIALGLDPRRYAGHSLRAGIATDMFASGMMTPAQIMKFGRWASMEACMVYFRETSEVTELISHVIRKMS